MPENQSLLFEELATLFLRQARLIDEANGLEARVVQSGLRLQMPVDSDPDIVAVEIDESKRQLRRAKIAVGMNARRIAELLMKVDPIIRTQSEESIEMDPEN